MRMTDPSGGAMGSDEYCLVFLHIPKTAGVTIGTALRRNFRKGETIHLKTL